MQTIATELDVHIHGLFLTVTEKFSNSTDFYHVTSEHKMDFSVEFFTPRSRNGNQIVQNLFVHDPTMHGPTIHDSCTNYTFLCMLINRLTGDTSHHI